MKVKITLKDLLTNVVKVIYEENISLELAEYMWYEGNYSCDCNIGIFFYPEEDMRYECGEERFEIVSIEEC